MTTELKLSHCSFCGSHKDKVKKLIVSEDVAICSDCIDLCNQLMLDDITEKMPEIKSEYQYDPITIKEYLDGTEDDIKNLREFLAEYVTLND